MDDLETRLATLLSEPGDDDAPPPDLARRIHRAVATRRVRRRAAMVSVAAGALAVAVAVPIALRTGGSNTTAKVDPSPVWSTPNVVRISPKEPPTTYTPILTSDSPELATIADIREVVDMPGSLVIPGRTPTGQDFLPDTVGPEGTVLGFTPDHRVWESGQDGTLRDLGVESPAGLGAGTGFRTWIRQQGDNKDQVCKGPDGVTRTISPQGAAPDLPVWVDNGMIIGRDIMQQAWITNGCNGIGRNTVIAYTGSAVAVSYPTLFTVETLERQRLFEIDLKTMKVAVEHPLPEGIAEGKENQVIQPWLAAANKDYFAWVADGMLRFSARDSLGKVSGHRLVPPSGEGPKPRLTAGNRLIAYTTGTESVVLDLRTNATYNLPGVAYAAGDWLLWRVDSGYLLARAR